MYILQKYMYFTYIKLIIKQKWPLTRSPVGKPSDLLQGEGGFVFCAYSEAWNHSGERRDLMLQNQCSYPLGHKTDCEFNRGLIRNEIFKRSKQ